MPAPPRTVLLTGVLAIALAVPVTVSRETGPAAAAPASTRIRIGTASDLPNEPVERAAGPLLPGISGGNHRWLADGLGMWIPDAPGEGIPGEPVERMTTLAKRAKLGLVRYPGGTVANLFDWKKAVGPDRGCQYNGGFISTGDIPDSRYGPMENEEFVDRIPASTSIMMPATISTLSDAEDFVEFMNAEADEDLNGDGVFWGRKRAEWGHPAPYDIKVWEIGNEPYLLQNQRYWRSSDPATALRQYIEGGSAFQTAQPVAKGCDRSAGASRADAGQQPSQRFRAYYPPIAADTREQLTVGGQPWTRGDDLAGQPAGARVYTLNRRTGEITFGDGVHGSIPPANAEVRFSYQSGPHPGYIQYRNRMKAADPSIDVCASWGKKVFVETMGSRQYDCLGFHGYTFPDFDQVDTIGKAHDWLMPAAAGVGSGLRELRDLIDARFPAGSRPYLFTSEYGAIGKDGTTAPAGFGGSLTHTLYLSSMLTPMIESGVREAVNSNLNIHRSGATGELFGGAPDFVYTARANLLRMYARLAGTRPWKRNLDDNPVTGPGYEALRVLVTTGADGRRKIVITNRDKANAVPVRILGAGNPTVRTITVHTLNGPSISSYNTATDEPVSTRTVTRQLDRDASDFGHTVPAHSVVLIEVPPA